MKKILISFFFILFSVLCFGQALQFPAAPGSLTSIPTAPAGTKNKLYGWIPIKDTLNNAATNYVGAFTIRPQDTISSDTPPVYVSNGHWWYKIGPNGGGGSTNSIDSIKVNGDSSLYLAWGQGMILFTFPTLLQKVKAGTGIIFTRNGDSLVISALGSGKIDTIRVSADSLYLEVVYSSGHIDSINFAGGGGGSGVTVSSYGKNAGGDSTILLLSNGTRYAAFDRTGGAGGITALTGDVTASGSGSVAATLATVNSNVGSFTNASITVNGKGLITAASSGTAITTSEQVITATASQTAFTFTSVPATYSDYMVFVNGGLWQSTTGYTTSSNTVTLTSALDAGDIVTFRRTK